MEEHLGHDFRDVRVHTDSDAAKAASSMDALAYTSGRDVVFDVGRYDPGTETGDRLLAHELTHVVQQRQGRADGPQRSPQFPAGRDELEEEAEGFGITAGRRSRDTTSRGSTLPYREAMQSIITPRKRPAGASLPDTRPPVLEADRTMFTDLSGYVSRLPGRVRALVSAGNPGEPWLVADNVYVQSALRVLDRLVGDIARPNFVVRFDQPAAGAEAASYDFANNEMHLRRFASAEERTLLSVDLLHEYAHVLQDREAEQVFARSAAPKVETKKEDLKREIAARREQVYFGEMLRLLREPVPMNAIFGSQLEGMVFRERFERERIGKTKAIRKAATREIRKSLESAYSAQLTRNASIKTYSVQIDSRNHALLHWDLPGKPTPNDLGEIPKSLTNREELQGWLAGAIQGLPNFAALSRRPKGQHFTTLMFEVRWGDDPIIGFALEP